MNLRESTGRNGRTLATLLWAAVAISWLAGMFLSSLPLRLKGDDDRLYLYSTGLALAHPGVADRLNEDIANFLRDEGYGRHALFRWDQRMRYQYNYVLPSAVMYGISRIVGPASYSDYTDFLYAVVPLGIVTWYGLTLLALAAGLAVTRSVHVAAFVAGVVIFRIAFDAFIEVEAPTRLVMLGGLPHTLLAAGESLLNPGSSFSILGSTPRNLLIILMMLVFAWRIHGWHARSYWLLLALGLVHQGMAGLALLSLVGVDLLLRPRALLRWLTVIPITAGILMFLLRDRLLFTFLSPAAAGMAVAALIGVGYLIWLRRGGTGLRVPERDAPESRFPRAIAAEMALLLAQFGACLFISYFMATRADEFVAHYFWRELPGRFVALVQPGLMMLAMHYIVCGARRNSWPRFLRRWTGRSATFAICTALLLGAGILFGQRISAEFPRLRADLARLELMASSFGQEESSARQQSFDAIQQREALLFSAFSETIDRRNDALGTLLNRARTR